MQNLVLLIDSSDKKSDISLKAGKMCLNRFCIDEEAAFELSGVNYLKRRSEVHGKYAKNCQLQLKVRSDEKIIDFALLKIIKSESKKLKTHFVYAGNFYWLNEDKLRSLIFKGMKKYNIKSTIVTLINMRRRSLITKEKTENYCKGKENKKISVNDDLESLFEDLRFGNEPYNYVFSYFLPKLTEKELELVESKDTSYLENFYLSFPDVEKTEMRLSGSDSKYVEGFCDRKTFTIENSLENSLEISSEETHFLKYPSENLSQNSSQNPLEKKFCCCTLQ